MFSSLQIFTRISSCEKVIKKTNQCEKCNRKKRNKNLKESKKGKNACNIVSYRCITSNFKCHEISLLIVMYLYGNSQNE